MKEIRFEQHKCAPSTVIRTQVKVLTTSVLGTNNMPPNPMYTLSDCRHWNLEGSLTNWCWHRFILYLSCTSLQGSERYLSISNSISESTIIKCNINFSGIQHKLCMGNSLYNSLICWLIKVAQFQSPLILFYYHINSSEIHHNLQWKTVHTIVWSI